MSGAVDNSTLVASLMVCKPHKVDYQTHHVLQRDNPTNLYIPSGAE